MNDSRAQQAFHRAMAENPEDDLVRGVYADWLRDRGHQIPSDRLDWVVGLHQRLRGPEPGHAEAPNDWDALRAVFHAHPAWVQRALDTHQVRKTLGEAIPENVRHVASVAERHAVGLADEGDLAEARETVHDTGPGGEYADRAGHYLLHPDPRTLELSPGRLAQWHRVGLGMGGNELFQDARKAAEYIRQNPPPAEEPERPVKLAAIEPPTAAQPSVLVKVPVPTPVEPKPKAAPAPAPTQTAPASAGPVFFLPQ